MSSAPKRAEEAKAIGSVPVQAGRFYDTRRLPDDRIAGVEPLAEGRARLVIDDHGCVDLAWEYPSISAALEAWFAWNPMSGKEPAGYERRDPA